MVVPEIPKAEYDQRVERVRQMMHAHQVEAVFVYHDELHMADGCYLTNYWPTIEAGAVLVPLDGEPLLLGGPEAQEYAREVSAVQQQRAVDAFVVPEEEYPGAVILSLPAVFAEALRGRPLQRLGLVGLGVMPHGLFESLRHAFPAVEFVDLSRDYVMLRAIKSEAEIAMLAHSFEIGAAGLRAAIPLIKPGASEYALIGAAEGCMRSLGIDGFNFRGLSASGPRSNGVVPPASDKLMQAGELVLVGFSPKHRGYAAGVSCTFAVNHPPTAEQHHFLGHLAEALRLTRDALRPGLRGREIDAIPRNFLAGHGYGPYLTMGIVHTVGLNEYEQPFFGPNSDEVLQPNMTVCIDVSMFGHPEFYGSRVEAGYVIRETGAQPLSTTLEDLILSLREREGIWSQGRS
jgi:Xaa-Pro aminopeptidase